MTGRPPVWENRIKSTIFKEKGENAMDTAASYFEDFHVGDTHTTYSRTMTETDICLLYTSQNQSRAALRCGRSKFAAANFRCYFLTLLRFLQPAFPGKSVRRIPDSTEAAEIVRSC